jgi:mono/diheme cytochrome c family protein
MQVPAGASSPLPMGLTEVSLMAWRNNCVTCHGKMGRGDGPQGPMVKARDLSDPAWQGSVTDAQIAESIVKGRGRMPAFALPTSTVDELVRLVRLIGRSRGATAPPSSAQATPSTSASATP